MSPASPAQRKATDKYIRETFDELKVRVPKGRKEAIQAAASAQGESLNGFISTAVDERIERLQGAQDDSAEREKECE